MNVSENLAIRARMATVERLVAPFRGLPVGCDAMARLVFTELEEFGFAPVGVLGFVNWNDQTVLPFHYWVMVGEITIDMQCVDLLRGHPMVGILQHGVFVDAPSGWARIPVERINMRLRIGQKNELMRKK